MIELQIIDGLRPDLIVVRDKTFGVQGGVLGRDPACDWVLLDRQRLISGRHARISYRQDGFYLTDMSANGVLDASGRAFNKNEMHLLKVGEVFIIGPYRIEVKTIKNAHGDLQFNEDLQHLLMEGSKSQGLTPFDYVAKTEAVHTGVAHFDLKEQGQGTLKAYEFMPEPLDLVLNVRGGEVQEQLSPEIASSQEIQPAVSQEDKFPVSVESLGVPTDFVSFFEALGLDARLFSGISDDDLQNKLVSLLQGLLRMSIELRTTLQVFQKNFEYLNESANDQHNPFYTAVSSRQLFELLLRDDSEFMDVNASLLEIKTDLLRVKKFLDVLPLVSQQLLAQVDPQLFSKPHTHRFNLLQERHAWQAYQQHYQNLAQHDARAWLVQLQQLVKEKI